MTRTVDFVDRFWDQDFCGTRGYEILVKRLKDGRTTCKVWHDFLTTRAKIEEEYADKLRKSVKSKDCPERGTLASSWDQVRAMTDAIATEHASIGKELSRAAERIHVFSAKLKATRTEEENTMSKSQKHKKELYNKCLERKKSYHSATQEAEQLEASKSASGYVTNLSAEKQEKMLNKIKDAKTRSEKTNSVYKEAVEQLERARQMWEKDMEHACREFEKLEVERFDFLRNEMWIHSNLVSQCAVDVDAHCEQIRLSLEKVDVDRDLTDFITKNTTGNTRPGKVHYEAYGLPVQRTQTISRHRPQQPLPHKFQLPRPGHS